MMTLEHIKLIEQTKKTIKLINRLVSENKKQIEANERMMMR